MQLFRAYEPGSVGAARAPPSGSAHLGGALVALPAAARHRQWAVAAGPGGGYMNATVGA